LLAHDLQDLLHILASPVAVPEHPSNSLINAMRKGLSCDYVQVGVVGNEVAHFHIHLIPRFLDEEVTQTNRPHVPYENSDEMVSYAQKISSGLR
jgi:diadenosine tetraphosphate (Ap4A) HIT family hydrolase